MEMKVWIDADACPRAVKDVVFRASERLKLPVCLVADRLVGRPPSPLVSTVRVPKGMDQADKYIADKVNANDIVITADIPLAAAVVEKGAVAINPRGEQYDRETVRERLSVRDFMAQLRETGVETGGPPPFGPKDKQRFAATFDRLLTAKQNEHT